MINFRKKKENPEEEQDVDLADNLENAGMTDDSEMAENAETVKEMPDISGKPDPEDAEDVFMAEAEAYVRGKGIDESQLRDALDFIEGLRKLKDNEHPTLEMLETVLQGIDYSRAISEAKAEGELAGRNRQIEEVYMRPEATDGLPHLGDSGAVRKNNRSMTSIFDLARSAS